MGEWMVRSSDISSLGGVGNLPTSPFNFVGGGVEGGGHWSTPREKSPINYDQNLKNQQRSTLNKT
jgi:hypothetical protein